MTEEQKKAQEADLEAKKKLATADDDDADDDVDEEPDYKSMYESKAAEADKWKNRFKGTKKEINELKKWANWNPDKGTPDVQTLVQTKVSEEMFFQWNSDAAKFKKEIQEIQGKYNMPVQEARTFYLANNSPDLLAKRWSANWWVDGVTADDKWVTWKAVKDMTDEEVEAAWANRDR